MTTTPSRITSKTRSRAMGTRSKSLSLKMPTTIVTPVTVRAKGVGSRLHGPLRKSSAIWASQGQSTPAAKMKAWARNTPEAMKSLRAIR